MKLMQFMNGMNDGNELSEFCDDDYDEKVHLMEQKHLCFNVIYEKFLFFTHILTIIRTKTSNR